MIDPLFKALGYFVQRGCIQGKVNSPFPAKPFFLNGRKHFFLGYRMNKFQQKIPGIFGGSNTMTHRCGWSRAQVIAEGGAFLMRGRKRKGT